MDAIQIFLGRHKRMHAHIARLTEGLSEAQMRQACVYPAANPLAWLLWHMTRVEDGAVNLLIGHGPQVLNEAWLARLGITRRDVGSGMARAEVVDLCAAVDLSALRAYSAAVAERTAAFVAALTPTDLDAVVSAEHIRWAFEAEHMVEGPTGTRLQAVWRDMTRGYFLFFLPITHTYEHIGQADLLRGLLGLPGPY